MKEKNFKELEKMYREKQVIYIIKKEWGLGKIKKELCKIINKKEYTSECIASLFPKTANEMNQKNFLIEEVPLEKQMVWAANIIYIYRKNINSFILLKENFDFNLIIGNYKKATEVLEKIKKNFGVSIWYYESKLLVHQYENNRKLDDKLFKEIREEFEHNITGKFIIEHINFRLQMNITYANFKKEIYRTVDSFRGKIFDEFLDYLLFKTDPFACVKNFNLAEILNFDSHSSLIDYYLTFKKIVSNLCSDINDNEILLTQILKILDGKIEDAIIKNLYYLVGIKKVDNDYIDSNVNILRILDFYTEGKYDECKNLILKEVKNGKISDEILEIYPKCELKINLEKEEENFKNSIIFNYFDNKKSVECREGNLQYIFNNLKKMASDLNATVLGTHIIGVLINDYNKFDIDKKEQSFSYINYSPLNPIFYERFNDFKRSKIITEISAKYDCSKTLKLYKAIWDKDSNLLKSLKLPKRRYFRYSAEILVSKNRYEEAIKIYRQLECSCEVNELNQVVRGLINCLINIGEIEECINIVVNYYLKNNNLCIDIPLVDIINKMDDELSCYLNLAILYSIHSRSITETEENDKELEDRIFDQYENYLDSKCLLKPSNLFDSEIDDKKLYFLENICTVNIMSNSTAFNDSFDLEEERSKILNFLIKYYKSKKQNKEIISDKYLMEMTNISEKKILRKSVNEVGKNKINIDLDSIKIELNKDLKNKFYKYLSNIDNNITEVEYVVEDVKLSEESDIYGHIPKDQNINLFYSIMLELRDIYVTKLDCCLGPEIRHGKLISQLRVPFEKEHLITTKDTKLGKYMENVYWINKYVNLGEEVCKKIDYELVCFTMNLYKLFNEVKYQWIQIFTEKNDNIKGLFNFYLEIDLIESVKEKIDINSSFDDFIDIVLEKLWVLTDKNLENIRSKLTMELNKIIEEECVKLIKNLTSIKDTENRLLCVELINSIKTSKTQSDYNLRSISEWFHFSNELDGKPYNIEHAVNVAIEIIKSMNPNNSILVNVINVTNIMLPRRTLNNFVNIFFTICENAITHKSNNEINIELKMEFLEKNIVKIRYINCSGYNPQSYEIEKLKIINEKLKSDVSNDDIIQEGGTGFLKIRKILTIDLKYDVRNIVLYFSEDKFIADIVFSLGEI